MHKLMVLHKHTKEKHTGKLMRNFIKKLYLLKEYLFVVFCSFYSDAILENEDLASWRLRAPENEEKNLHTLTEGNESKRKTHYVK